MEFRERLALAIKDSGLSQKEIAARVGVSPGAVTQWKNGTTKSLEGGNLLKVAQVLGVSALWLAEGRGSKAPLVAASDGKTTFDQNVEMAIPGCRVPIIDYVQAGAWREIADPFPPGMAFEYLISFAELSGNAFALRIKGDSMQPDFIEGDVIVVDPAVSPRPGSFVVAKNGGEEATFKKYRSRGVDPATGDDIFELVPLNDDYPTLRSDECRCVIIGTAVEVRKRLR